MEQRERERERERERDTSWKIGNVVNAFPYVAHASHSAENGGTAMARKSKRDSSPGAFLSEKAAFLTVRKLLASRGGSICTKERSSEKCKSARFDRIRNNDLTI